MAKFNTGDVVKLKSGGPKMTVVQVGELSEFDTRIHVWCTWFDEGKESTGCYPEDAVDVA